MNEKFESTFDFLAKIQRRKMTEEVEVKHTVVKDICAIGVTQDVDVKKVKRRVDKAKPAKAKVEKDPSDVEHTKATVTATRSKVNEDVIVLAAIEKILNADSNGKDGALGVIDYLKSLSGGKMDPQIEEYINNLLGIINRKPVEDKVEKNVDTGRTPKI